MHPISSRVSILDPGAEQVLHAGRQLVAAGLPADAQGYFCKPRPRYSRSSHRYCVDLIYGFARMLRKQFRDDIEYNLELGALVARLHGMAECTQCKINMNVRITVRKY